MLGALSRLVDGRTECKTAGGAAGTPIKDVMGYGEAANPDRRPRPRDQSPRSRATADARAAGSRPAVGRRCLFEARRRPLTRPSRSRQHADPRACGALRPGVLAAAARRRTYPDCGSGWYLPPRHRRNPLPITLLNANKIGCMADGELAIVIAGRREDWPGGPRNPDAARAHPGAERNALVRGRARPRRRPGLVPDRGRGHRPDARGDARGPRAPPRRRPHRVDHAGPPDRDAPRPPQPAR